MPSSESARVRQQLDGVAELAREGHVVVVQRVDALERHVVDVQMAVECERGQDRELGGGVGAADVLGGVGLGIAELLRLGERVGVALAVARHRGEHEVGRAVDDADELVDAGGCERLLQHAHDGNGGAGRGLVAQLRAAAVGCLLQLGAVAREQLLVGRDDRDAALEQLAQIAERRLDAAHHLGHDLDRRVVADVLEAVGEQAGRRALALARGVAHERAHDAHGPAGHALDDVRALAQQPVDRRADGAVAEQADAERFAGHGPG